jgi:hypothetical protein
VLKSHRGGWLYPNAQKRKPVLAMSEIKIRPVIAWFFKHCPVYVMMVPLVPMPHSGAYLPLIGPPALRFEAVVQYKDIYAWMPKPKPAPIAMVETNSQPVNSTMPTNNAVTTATVVTPEPTSLVSSSENLSTNSSPPVQSANNLLVVTPEMLVDYFKPNNLNTNASDVRVVAPLQFTPPAPASSPSSQAIYQSQ